MALPAERAGPGYGQSVGCRRPVMDPRDFNLRWFLIAAVAAVLVAAALRHTIHIYGGIERHSIGLAALIGAAVLLSLLAILSARIRR